MGFKRARDTSDGGSEFMPPKRLRRLDQPGLPAAISVERALSLPPSSPPAPVTPDGTPQYTNDVDFPTPDFEAQELSRGRLPALLPFLFPSSSSVAPSHSLGQPEAPERGPMLERAQSVEPRGSSPVSLINVTPLKPRRGRPAYTPRTRALKQSIQKFSSSTRTPDKKKFQEASEELQKKITAREQAARERTKMQAREKTLAAERAAKEKAEEQAATDAQDTLRAQRVIDLITSDANGGFNFDSLEHFFDSLWRTGGDAAISSKISRYIQRHGAEHAEGMFKRSKSAKDDYITAAMAKIFQQEGRAIQAILTRNSTTTVTELLKEFSLDQLGEKIQAAAPTLWAALAVLATPDSSTRKETHGETRRNKPLVFTTICALISILRSQRANNFQLVIGLFLLGSGASKREISVLAHAGLSISYAAIIEHVKILSKEGLDKIRQVVSEGMVQIVWDNLNIAFRVAAQRLKAKNHFDNGTTGTVLPVFDPATGGQAAHGTLPLNMKPPRERTLPVLDWTPDDVLPSPESAAQLSDSCFWQLKRMALEHIPGMPDGLKKELGECPEVNQIPLHKTAQFPVPAMQEDESTLDGNLRVRATIYETIGLDDEKLETHGLVGEDGDLMTDGLKDKVCVDLL